MRVILEILDGEPVSLGHPDLLEDRVGLHVDAHRAAHLLLAEPAGAADVEDRVGLAIEAGQPFAGEAVVRAGHAVHVGPAVG